MHIRERNGNLSLERPVYTAAVRNAAGEVVTPSRRSTLYLGSVRSHTRFDAVPRELHEKLTEDEREQLREALKSNEPKSDMYLSLLPHSLKQAGAELIRAAQADPSPEAHARLKQQLKGLEAAWDTFLKAAQTAGLRRVVVRKKAAAPTPSTAE